MLYGKRPMVKSVVAWCCRLQQSARMALVAVVTVSSHSAGFGAHEITTISNRGPLSQTSYATDATVWRLTLATVQCSDDIRRILVLLLLLLLLLLHYYRCIISNWFVGKEHFFPTSCNDHNLLLWWLSLMYFVAHRESFQIFCWRYFIELL